MQAIISLAINNTLISPIDQCGNSPPTCEKVLLMYSNLEELIVPSIEPLVKTEQTWF
jgi:hypothetical protein